MLRFVSDGTVGGYDVLQDGVRIGAVTKYEKRWNLRRVYVTRGWLAFPPTGPALRAREGGEATVYHTRAEAADALLSRATPRAV